MISRYIAKLIRPAVVELPALSGERMKLSEVTGALHGARENDAVRALIQILWMHRCAADNDARACAAADQGSRDYSLGGMQLVDNVLHDMQILSTENAPPPEGVKQWFRA